MDNTRLTLTDVSYKSGFAYLLKSINLQIDCGQNWVVFGANGSGKTTLLSVMGGYRKPAKGSVCYKNTPYEADNIAAIRQKTALVSTSYLDNCFRQETALEIVLSALGDGFGLPEETKSADVRRAKHLLSALGLKEKHSYPYSLLSKGQRQCVLIARALISKPELLLLDEVYAGLDVYMRELIEQSLNLLLDETATNIVLVTHDPRDITTRYTHALLLKDGKIFSCGTVNEVFNSEILASYFNTSVTVNWQNGRLSLIPRLKTPLIHFYA